ncbi:Shufflon-specific DNA recombinase [Pseudomonas amygdali]|uniref:Shufflon-specific DNA recombinase n=1 Tax=Pseudomonas amygdali TaxID=47877 RepID=UPI001F228E5D|nr:Shufflon-specific DNA recombinase [Pseudomonas amygdali]
MVEMATIRNRGEYQWEAQIRRKGYPAQRKTFETKSDAQAWARMIESEIDRGIFVSRVEAERTAFHQLIDRYISEIAPKHKGAYSEIKRLEALKRHPLATRIVATLTSSDFARYRDERLKIRKGNTVKRELALFQCVIEVARREWGIHLAENPVRMVSRPSYNDERSRRLDPIEEQYMLDRNRHRGESQSDQCTLGCSGCAGASFLASYDIRVILFLINWLEPTCLVH